MITWLAPLGLIAFAALAVPPLVHLLRRTERKPVDFAALQWLRARRSARARPRLHEHVLLILRLLAIAVLALLLAEPAWRARGRGDPPVIAVADGVSASAARAAVPGASEDARWMRLASGFPTLDAAPAPAQQPLASLLRELDAQLPPAVALTVVVPAQVAGLDAQRVLLGRSVDWRIVPGEPLPERPAAAGAPAFHRLALRGLDAAETRTARALVAAWEAAGLMLEVEESAVAGSVAPETDMLIGHGEDVARQTAPWIAGGGVALIAGDMSAEGAVEVRDDAGNPLVRVRTIGRGRLLSFPGPLDPRAQPALADAGFPARLLEAMRPPAAAPDRAFARAAAPRQVERPPAGPAWPLEPGLAFLAALLFLIERVWATRLPRAAEAA